MTTFAYLIGAWLLQLPYTGQVGFLEPTITTPHVSDILAAHANDLANIRELDIIVNLDVALFAFSTGQAQTYCMKLESLLDISERRRLNDAHESLLCAQSQFIDTQIVAILYKCGTYGFPIRSHSWIQEIAMLTSSPEPLGTPWLFAAVQTRQEFVVDLLIDRVYRTPFIEEIAILDGHREFRESGRLQNAILDLWNCHSGNLSTGELSNEEQNRLVVLAARYGRRDALLEFSRRIELSEQGRIGEPTWSLTKQSFYAICPGARVSSSLHVWVRENLDSLRYDDNSHTYLLVEPYLLR